MGNGSVSFVFSGTFTLLTPFQILSYIYCFLDILSSFSYISLINWAIYESMF